MSIRSNKSPWSMMVLTTVLSFMLIFGTFIQPRSVHAGAGHENITDTYLRQALHDLNGSKTVLQSYIEILELDGIAWSEDFATLAAEMEAMAAERQMGVST